MPELGAAAVRSQGRPRASAAKAAERRSTGMQKDQGSESRRGSLQQRHAALQEGYAASFLTGFLAYHQPRPLCDHHHGKAQPGWKENARPNKLLVNLWSAGASRPRVPGASGARPWGTF